MPSATRIATLVAFVAIAAVTLFAAVDRWRAGSLSARLAPDGPTSNFRYVVMSAPRGSRLHRGDRVEIDDPRALAAYQFHALAAGSTLRLERTAPAPAMMLDDPVVAAPLSNFASFVVAVEAMFLAVAALIAARGRTSGSLALAWFFALFVVLSNPTTPAWPPWFIVGYMVLSAPLFALTLACAIDFATRFSGNPQARSAQRVHRVSLALAVLGGTLSLGTMIVTFALPTMPVAVQNIPFVTVSAQTICFLVALVTAFISAPPPERQRIAWVVGSLAIGIVGLAVELALSQLGVAEPARDIPLLLLIAMPVGCAYAILRYRLLDIAFVINRATVFGITSLLVLGALALVDYGLSTLLGSWLVHHGTFVQLAVALGIGIATRPLHARVDRLVDDLFFRQRHEAERALRAFARDVAHIDQADVVLQRTVETVARTGLHCSLFLTGDHALRPAATSACADTAASAVAWNDEAVVRLRATREAVDLHALPTALPGDFAFPMVARDRLLGVLVCGGKTDGARAYAPDELDAIAAVAHATGLALDLLRVEALERQLAALQGFIAPPQFAAE